MRRGGERREKEDRKWECNLGGGIVSKVCSVVWAGAAVRNRTRVPGNTKLELRVDAEKERRKGG
jgi:hypothetical protein